VTLPPGAAALATPNLGKLAIAIALREGDDRPGTVPERLNNPGDLMYVRQVGAKPHPIVGKDGKTRVYAEFPTALAGWVALFEQIRLDAARGKTLEEFIGKYAPASDNNDPTSYLSFVMRQLGCQNPKTKLADLVK
jgi:hypothetical protein